MAAGLSAPFPRLALAAVLALAAAGGAVAQTRAPTQQKGQVQGHGQGASQLLFKRGAWEVRAVHWADGAGACLAEVREGREVFSIFADHRNPVRLQFYSAKWTFGDRPRRGDLAIAVDGGGTLKVRGASLLRQSLLFDLPGGPAGQKLLDRIAAGHVLQLIDARGQVVRRYSLSGAAASMQALGRCLKDLG